MEATSLDAEIREHGVDIADRLMSDADDEFDAATLENATFDSSAFWFLITTALLSFSVFYSLTLPHVMFPLLSLTQTQMAILISAHSLPNIVMPHVSRRLVTSIGPRACICIFALLVVAGTSLFVIGLSPTINFNLLVVARLLLGLGGESIGCAQSLLVFPALNGNGRILSSALSINLVVTRLGSIVTCFISPIIVISQGEAMDGVISAFLVACALAVAAAVGVFIAVCLYSDQEPEPQPPARPLSTISWSTTESAASVEISTPQHNRWSLHMSSFPPLPRDSFQARRPVSIAISVQNSRRGSWEGWDWRRHRVSNYGSFQEEGSIYSIDPMDPNLPFNIISAAQESSLKTPSLSSYSSSIRPFRILLPEIFTLLCMHAAWQTVTSLYTSISVAPLPTSAFFLAAAEVSALVLTPIALPHLSTSRGLALAAISAILVPLFASPWSTAILAVCVEAASARLWHRLSICCSYSPTENNDVAWIIACLNAGTAVTPFIAAWVCSGFGPLGVGLFAGGLVTLGFAVWMASGGDRLDDCEDDGYLKGNDGDIDSGFSDGSDEHRPRMFQEGVELILEPSDNPTSHPPPLQIARGLDGMKLGYCIFYVTDVEKTVEFYERAFGLKRRFIHESGYGELDTGSTALAFCDHKLAGSHGFDYTKISPESPSPPMEIGLVVEDVEKSFEIAVNAGASVLARPEKKPWGQVVAYVKDLNGFAVELCTAIP